ncbi:MAG: NAD-dependent DNA ligase LigA [Candidatus Spechtbacteria bacterium SB0662_bin_43]|uniref:DNA ligase n=1 Tax=Candidatus Spechtbacteria bacterium SB0662_bin_43 TaxID=2604897 RepID=A0A845DBA7_9BACT|nr:NAD-dependent DNA ligase LigA [Candidatus Spechtbacteria bacterium SB0662_bin_43]
MKKTDSRKEAQKRLSVLKRLIDSYSYEYYVLDNPSVSDEVFDSLKNELRDLEERFPALVAPDSFTQRVGGEPLAMFEKVQHSYPMLSIEDLFTESECRDWEEFLKKQCDNKEIVYFCEGKIDGLAIALRYRKGVLRQAITRGNGVYGEEVLSNIKTIPSVPLRVQIYDATLHDRLTPFVSSVPFEVRGEVYITTKDFEEYNNKRKKKGENVYANPRNLAAGSIRQLDPKVAQERPLSFRAYDILEEQGIFASHSDKHQALRAMGFPVDLRGCECADIDAVVGFWKQIEKDRSTMIVPMDGVVVRVNDSALFRELGVVGRSPRGIRALKFAPKTATTMLKDIVIQVGRTGVATPVAVLEPVELGGVVVSRASLHNKEEIERLGVMIGDTVIVARAGDVIPVIEGVLPEMRTGTEKRFTMPRVCPSCNTPFTQDDEEVALRCTNDSCTSRVKEALSYFVSRNNFNIEGLGTQLIHQLVDTGLVTDVADIFRLTKEDIMQLDFYAEKSASNIIQAIQGAKTIPLAKLIAALNIRHVGEETAIDLAQKFGTLRAIQAASPADLNAVRGVGETVSRSVHEWFANQKNQDLLRRLVEAGVVVVSPQKSTNKALSNTSFVFTGTLSLLDRNEAQAKVRERGGTVATSVSSQTSFVVVGTNPGSKKDTAERLGVSLLSEDEFMKLLQE